MASGVAALWKVEAEAGDDPGRSVEERGNAADFSLVWGGVWLVAGAEEAVSRAAWDGAAILALDTAAAKALTKAVQVGNRW